MLAGVADLLIQQGETFERTISPMTNKTSARTSVNTQALPAATSIVLATGGLGAIAINDYILINSKQYQATNAIADLSLGGTLTLNKPLLDTVDAGTSLTIYSPFDLTGYTARASIRPTADSTTELVDFTCSINSNKITISLTDAQTSALPTPEKQYYNKLMKYTWDLEIIDSSLKVSRLLNGLVTVSPEVTR
jgi:hypothetical protein